MTELRVMLVGDDLETVATTAFLLRMQGHELQVALNGRMALRIAEIVQPEVVILDISTPESDGWLVAKQIRERAAKNRPFLIAITGSSREELRLGSTQSGIDLHLVKPVVPSRLLEHLARFQARQMPGLTE